MKALQTKNGNLLIKVSQDLFLYTNINLLPIGLSNKKEYKWLKKIVQNEIEINETNHLLESYKNIEYINYMYGNVFGVSISDWADKSFWFSVIDGETIHSYKGVFQINDFSELAKEVYFNFLSGNTSQYKHMHSNQIKIDKEEKEENSQNIYHNSCRSILRNRCGFEVHLKGVKQPFTLDIDKTTLAVTFRWKEDSSRKQSESILDYFNGKKMQSKFKRTKFAMNG